MDVRFIVTFDIENGLESITAEEIVEEKPSLGESTLASPSYAAIAAEITATNSSSFDKSSCTGTLSGTEIEIQKNFMM